MSDQYLYSPWRLDYIQSEKPDECILCLCQNRGTDEENLVVHRGKHWFAMLNRYPYNNGHIMLAPYLHERRLSDLPDEVMDELGDLLQISEQALQYTYNCDGINIGINLGRAAGAGIEEHLHVHLVPRWNGDSNFMSVVAGQRVIPESFSVSFARLREAFSKILNDNE